MAVARGDENGGTEIIERRRAKCKLCPFCQRLFLTVCDVFEHIATSSCGVDYRLRSEVCGHAHRTALTRLQCDICGLYFKSLWFLARHHLWVHHDLTTDIVERMFATLEEQPLFQQRWCDFVLRPPTNYETSDEEDEEAVEIGPSETS